VKWEVYAKRIRDNLDREFIKILDEEEIQIPESIKVKTKFRAPSGKAQQYVKQTIPPDSPQTRSNVRITTIHEVKGETLDAAMLVSSPNNQGKGGGYWENWLEDATHEHARFAYVASSRPKHLLIWAIPEKSVNEENKRKLAELGFSYSELEID